MFGDTKNKPLRLNDLLDFHLSERCDNIQSLFPTPLARLPQLEGQIEFFQRFGSRNLLLGRD